MNNKEKQDYLKHCCEHYELLTGGRRHSKTKEVIEDMQKEIEKLKNIIDELEYFIKTYSIPEFTPNEPHRDFMETKIILDKLKELKNK